MSHIAQNAGVHAGLAKEFVMRLKLLNGLIVSLAIVFVLTLPYRVAYAGFASQNGLNGLTSVYSYDFGRVRMYEGHAWSYSASGSPVYHIFIRVSNWNDCDYVHEVSNAFQERYHYHVVHAAGVLGSSQCASTTWMRVDGYHHMRRTASSVVTSLYTNEFKFPPY